VISISAKPSRKIAYREVNRISNVEQGMMNIEGSRISKTNNNEEERKWL
jgi:hypothetical protein